ncbi:MAG: spore germination protein, partial [Paenibacillus sp.]|nr:spore germination protein [Paenibacillus sp.]
MIYNPWQFGPDFGSKACSIYYSSLVQEDAINYMKHSLQDLEMHEVGPGTEVTIQELRTFFEKKGVSAQKATIVGDLQSLVTEITNGRLVILFDEWDKAISYKAESVETRQVDEPVNESVVIGPRESTVENLQKNLGL